ncbi:flippase-like domain-containing protein [Kitasatospora sp. NA04385]|uniref:lysylphosphatidylglycerol synthase transmembrane domain-containing protein n=1 Tax=Kitasatospora sp. NA04385 TaxID=2742135 RepID=UPI001591BE03|nr:lysylphosphatidylglycerol synthase transmembrane domain-containing protein [Kitasatospora sp. NA04385]QKW20248.1 flippase-like domain-containing protein [Kitasatospora sp. NA04385]
MATVIQADESRESRTPPRRTPARRVDRVRHPAALIRLAAGGCWIALVLLLACYARSSALGLDSDVARGVELLPWPPAKLTAALCGAALLTVPLGFAVDRVLRGEGRRVADGVLAAVLAYGLSLGLDLLAGDLAALTHPLPSGLGRTDPVYGHLAPVLAFMTALGTAGRRRWRTALGVTLGLSGLSGLVTGYATPLSLVLALLLGWTTAHAARYAVGEPVGEPTEEQIAVALAGTGVRPSAVLMLGSGRYLVTQHDGRPDLDVHLLDRYAQASGLLGHLWLALRLRTAPRPLGLRPLRAVLEHQTLLGHAASAAGARTRIPLAVVELGPDAALVAYRRIDARPFAALFDELPDPDGDGTGDNGTDDGGTGGGTETDAGPTDAELRDAWQQLALLQRRRIAHRSLSPNTVLLDAEGRVHLVGLAHGEIAASELLLRLDVAGLLAVLALYAGPQRAVRAAVEVLGAGPVSAALPLLQPIALARRTRAALARHGELAAALRAEVQGQTPRSTAVPVRLERLRPRTLLAIVACVVVGYALLQFSNPVDVIAAADPLWLAGAVLWAAVSYPVASFAFSGFVPEKLAFRSTLATQVAGSFVKVVAPGGVGGLALNTRYLQCANIPTAQAMSSIGVSQLFGLLLHMLQLAVFSALVGVDTASVGGESSSPLAGGWVLWLAGAATAVVAVSVAAVPSLRRRAQTLLRPLRAEVLPRLLDLAQRPGRLATGVAGQLLVSMCFVMCLYCCTRAVGQHPGFNAVAMTFLAGNAAGNVVPLPGGAGGVELLMPALLTLTGGVGAVGARDSVMLFRLLTFVLPVLPGWAAFAWLKRRGQI